MPPEDILARPITGIRPFNELPVNAEIWREAHNHHHLHRFLHAVSAHRSGIVTGLEVFASRTQERTLIVAPGVGIDANGQTIVLSEPVTLTLEEPRQTYIVLSFLRASDRSSAVTVGGGQEFYREVEGRDLRQTKDLPTTPYLELARIFRSGTDKAITDPKNPFAPGNDEVNGLYRRLAFPHCFADCTVGELSYVPKTTASPWNPNRAGLWNLLREGNGRGFHLSFGGPINLRVPAPDGSEPALLYVAGQQGFQPLAEAEIDGLRRFLDGGGLLVGEASGGSEEFAQSFRGLAKILGANLKDVARGHSLLTACHIFSAPPPGAHDLGVLQSDPETGVLFGTFDYGAAWQGELENPNAADARERIRQTQEFGLNMVAYAVQRRRLRELSQLS